MNFIKKSILTVIFIFITGTAYAGPVNINTATAESLAVNIKGVGLKKAEAIIAYRHANGPFKSIDELVKVKGIGQKLIVNNKDNLLISSK